MIRSVVALFIWTSSLAAAYAAEPFYAQSEALRHSYAVHMILARLEAARAVAERNAPELPVGELDKAASRDLPLLIGSLQMRDRTLADELTDALDEAIADVTRPGKPDSVPGRGARAIDLVRDAHHRLVPEATRRDVTFTAAVMTMLLLSDDGVAEGYEDAALGKRSELPVAWAALQQVQSLWNDSAALLADDEARFAFEEALADLHGLLPSPLPPEVFAGDPEDAEEPSHRIVAALERLTGASLYPDRDLVQVIGFAQSLAATGCQSYPTSADLGFEHVTWSRTYAAYFAKPLSLFGPGAMERLDTLYNQFAPSSERQSKAPCAELLEALDEARDVFSR